jgi:hypothetical protein
LPAIRATGVLAVEPLGAAGCPEMIRRSFGISAISILLATGPIPRINF